MQTLLTLTLPVARLLPSSQLLTSPASPRMTPLQRNFWKILGTLDNESANLREGVLGVVGTGYGGGWILGIEIEIDSDIILCP
ncbi:hypothetical protein L211DRAFT_843299 [Terfezia boudieri ATCC MYA-4762]|uniref:Uncharacterized protein n=1 Tax=Terfezia boudieri ATCC MYA-4762 TaxID=1051890 RepID=A0A3N4L794_9PEZI|nr:hypothetical protein L211DRAFT_843299 [Terfezia boudieri ATCC MYA-4762]